MAICSRSTSMQYAMIKETQQQWNADGDGQIGTDTAEDSDSLIRAGKNMRVVILRSPLGKKKTKKLEGTTG